MSLLMDALKRAEDEKKKAAVRTQNTSGEATERTTHGTAPKEDAESDTLSSPQSIVARQSQGEQTTKPKVDVDTRERELEPLPKQLQPKSVEPRAGDVDVEEAVHGPAMRQERRGSDVGDDEGCTGAAVPQAPATGIDEEITFPAARAIKSSITDFFEPSQSFSTVGQINAAPVESSPQDHNALPDMPGSKGASEPGSTSPSSAASIEAGLDHDATLPSARSIKASLKGYFDSSQAISMERDKGALPGILSTSSVDRGIGPSITRVSADTVFSATRSRRKSNVMSYCLWGLVLLVVMLGAVGLYYTSTAVSRNMPSPMVASTQAPPIPLVSAAEASPVVEVADQTAVGTRAFEPEAAQSPVVDVTVVEAPAPRDAEESVEVAFEPVVAQSEMVGKPEQPPIVKTEESVTATAPSNLTSEVVLESSAINITRSKPKRSSNVRIAAAYKAFLAGKYVEAKRSYEAVLKEHPDHRDALLGLAAIEVQRDNLEKAYRYYLYLRRQDPRDPVVNAALFNMQSRAGGEITESRLKLLLDQDPAASHVHFSLGTWYAKQARWTDAQQAYFDAFSTDNTNPDYAFNLAVSLDHLGQYRAAYDYYTKALELGDQRSVTFNTAHLLSRIKTLSGYLSLR